jgi:hypothetical protein
MMLDLPKHMLFFYRLKINHILYCNDSACIHVLGVDANSLLLTLSSTAQVTYDPVLVAGGEGGLKQMDGSVTLIRLAVKSA